MFACLHSQTNRALFVAIDKYPPNSGWAEIHATNDYNIILPILRESGYEDKNITTLINEKATKAAITKALTNLQRWSAKGDFIYVHFSCHGQQMLDDNGDEPDGFDEALIPYDALRRYKEGVYEGRNHLRDEELGSYLDRIRKKIGINGNLTVVLDACHSGTGTRDEDEEVFVRGTSYIFAPDDFELPERTADNLRLSLDNGKGLSPITVFSACKENGINYEYKHTDGKYYGSLTYAFCKLAFLARKMTIMDFSKALEEEMKKMFATKRWKQTPYIETTNDNKMFSIGETEGRR